MPLPQCELVPVFERKRRICHVCIKYSVLLCFSSRSTTSVVYLAMLLKLKNRLNIRKKMDTITLCKRLRAHIGNSSN